MFESFVNGWKVGSSTRKLVFKDKSLFFFPAFAAVLAIFEAVAIFAPVLFLTQSDMQIPAAIIALAAYYIIITFTSTYMTIAMMIAFRDRLAGKGIAFLAILKRASEYTIVILEWAIFYSIIIMLLNLLESRMKSIGSRVMVSALGSTAISLATVFALPVILDEKTGPIKTLSRSGSLITKNFGATFGGLVYTDLYGLVFVVLGLAVLAITAIMGLGTLVFAVGIAAFVMLFAVGSLVTTTTQSVFKLILYDRLNGKPLPQGFDKNLLDIAIKIKSQKKQNEVL
jgi:hypothetical protein